MGEPVKIRYLAEQMIRLAGREPGRDIRIEYTGLRPGEKLYEELFYAAEAYAPTPHAKIRVARPGVAGEPGAGAGGAARRGFVPAPTPGADPGRSGDPGATPLEGLTPSLDSLRTALAALPAALARGDEAEMTALLASVVREWQPHRPATAGSAGPGLAPAVSVSVSVSVSVPGAG